MELSLEDIEHRIARPIGRDPWIHYALNRAAPGCPDLQPVAFTAANGEELPERGADGYVDHPRDVRIEDRELVVSGLYEWFEEDFGDSEAGMPAHLRARAGPALRERLAGRDGYDDHEYDRTVNAP